MTSSNAQYIEATILKIKRLYTAQDYEQIKTLSLSLFDSKIRGELNIDNSLWYNVLYYLTQGMALTSDKNAAKYFLLTASEFPEESQHLESLIKIFNTRKDWIKSIEYSEELVSLYPNIWSGYWYLGSALRSTNQYDKATDIFNHLSDKFSTMHKGLQGQIEVVNQQHEWERAIQLSEQFISKYPKLWQGYWWKGQAHKNLGQYPEAKSEFYYLKNNFSSMHQGLENLASTANTQKDWIKCIEYAQEIVDFHPNVWSGYWYLGNGLRNTNQYDRATDIFSQLNDKFPTIHKGLQGQIEVANQQREWERAIQLSEQFISKYPKLWQGYWWKGQAHKNLKQYDEAKINFHTLKDKFPNIRQGWDSLYHIYLITDTFERALEFYTEKLETIGSTEKELLDHTKLLIERGLINKSQEIIDKIFEINQNSAYGYWANSLIYSSREDYLSAYNCTKNALEQCNSNKLLYKDIILSSQSTFRKIKKYKEYSSLINELKVLFPYDVLVIRCWVELPLWQHIPAIAWKKIAGRYEDVLSYNNDLVLLKSYIRKLLSCGELNKAEKLIESVIRSNSATQEFYKFYCLVSAYRKDHQQFEDRYTLFIEKFNYDNEQENQLFYHHMNCLIQLKQQGNVYEDYNTFNQFRYKNELNNIQLNTLQNDLLLKKFPEQLIKIPEKSTIYLRKTIFSKSIDDFNYLQLEPIINNVNNEVLVLCFEGLTAPIRSQYNHNKIQDTEILDSYWNKKSYDFLGFAKNTPKFNFILIKNLVDGFYQKDFECNLEIIQKQVSKIGHKYLITVGASAGAFASILFSNHLSVNIAYAFSPRIQAFMLESHPYYREFQMKYRLYNTKTLDIGYMQALNKGFDCKTYVSLCENEPCDFLSANSLNHSDPNLHVTYFHGDLHKCILYMGARNIYGEITKNIEAELATNFNLPINTDIFSHLKGFKYNSSLNRITTPKS